MAAKTYLVRFGTDNPANYTGISPTFTKFFNSAGNATTAPSISEIASSGMYAFSYDPTGFIGFVLDGTASLGTNVRYVAGALDPNDKVSETGISLIAMGASLIAQGATIGVIGSSLSVMGNSLSAIGVSLSAMGVSLTAQSSVIGVLGSSLSVFGNSMAVMGGSIAVMGTSLTAQGNTILGMGMTLGAIGVSFSAMGVSFVAGMSLIGSTGDSFGTDSVDPTTLFGFMKRLQELGEGDSIYTKSTGVWAIYNRGSTTTLRSKTITDSATTVTKV